MKNPTRYTCLLLLMLLSFTIQAQNQTAVKPTLFGNFPPIINCSLPEFDKVFISTVNHPVGLSFSDNFLFNGIVISSVVKYSNLTSVVMKSAEWDGTVFVLSKITDADAVTYAGRIINEKYNDGYELKKDTNNNYQFVKIETGKILQVCSEK
jgi:hypothetical protein